MGKRLRVKVTAANGVGSRSAYSNLTAAVSASANHVAASGSAAVGALAQR